MVNISLLVIIGSILGMIWFFYGERFNKKSMSMECWEKLHYLSKERFPLFLVHAKSILAGILLICLPYSKYKYRKELIIMLGASIIGLHIVQYYNELSIINENGKRINQVINHE